MDHYRKCCQSKHDFEFSRFDNPFCIIFRKKFATVMKKERVIESLGEGAFKFKNVCFANFPLACHTNYRTSSSIKSETRFGSQCFIWVNFDEFHRKTENTSTHRSSVARHACWCRTLWRKLPGIVKLLNMQSRNSIDAFLFSSFHFFCFCFVRDCADGYVLTKE